MDTIRHRSVDGCHVVAGEATGTGSGTVGGGGICKGPADLVGRHAGTRCHTSGGAKVDAADRGLRIGVASRRGSGVVAVTPVAGGAVNRITDRVEVGPPQGTTRSQETGNEVLGANQLVVAMHSRNEAFASLAAAGEGGRRRAISQGSAGAEGGHAVGVHAVGERRVFWPDATVDDANHHVFALDGCASHHLRPQAARCVEAQEVGRADGVELALFVFKDRRHLAVGAQGLQFSGRQPC